MKYLVLLIILFCAGCIEEFGAGLGTGMAAMKKLSEDAQRDFVASVNDLNAERARIDAEIAKIQDVEVREAIEALVDEQTTEAIKELTETDWKDPKVLTPWILALLGGVTAGYQKKKRTDGA
jgi:Sec-independent protein translocase protein TatA